jgi:hypothetical protein
MASLATFSISLHDFVRWAARKLKNLPWRGGLSPSGSKGNERENQVCDTPTITNAVNVVIVRVLSV